MHVTRPHIIPPDAILQVGLALSKAEKTNVRNRAEFGKTSLHPGDDGSANLCRDGCFEWVVVPQSMHHQRKPFGPHHHMREKRRERGGGGFHQDSYGSVMIFDLAVDAACP